MSNEFHASPLPPLPQDPWYVRATAWVIAFLIAAVPAFIGMLVVDVLLGDPMRLVLDAMLAALVGVVYVVWALVAKS